MKVGAIADLPNLTEFIADPMTVGFPEDFSALFGRAKASLLRTTLPTGPGLVTYRQRDIRELAANPLIGMAQYPDLPRFYRNLIFTTNPPIHGPLRQVIARPLSPRSIQRLGEVASGILGTLVEHVVEQDRIDFCTRFSERFTACFWAAMFEMTDTETAQLIDAARMIAPVTHFDLSSENTAAITAGMDSYLDLVSGAIRRALDSGGNELLESMAAAFQAIEPADRPARVEEMIAANVLDGVHTASVAISNVFYALLRSPEDLLAVRANPGLMPNAVSEGLRLWPPLIYTPRCALGDLEFSGVFIPKGTMITLLTAAGNRDPQAFEHPNHYNLFRRQQDQTTFGGGIHICPGRYMVALLARTTLEALLRPDIEICLVGEKPSWIARSSVRQLNCLPVSIRRSAYGAEVRP